MSKTFQIGKKHDVDLKAMEALRLEVQEDEVFYFLEPNISGKTTTVRTLTLSNDGSFTYVPDAGFFSVDTFEYQLTSTPPSMLQGEFSDTTIVTIKVIARQIFLPLILR